MRAQQRVQLIKQRHQDCPYLPILRCFRRHPARKQRFLARHQAVIRIGILQEAENCLDGIPRCFCAAERIPKSLHGRNQPDAQFVHIRRVVAIRERTQPLAAVDAVRDGVVLQRIGFVAGQGRKAAFCHLQHIRAEKSAGDATQCADEHPTQAVPRRTVLPRLIAGNPRALQRDGEDAGHTLRIRQRDRHILPRNAALVPALQRLRGESGFGIRVCGGMERQGGRVAGVHRAVAGEQVRFEVAEGFVAPVGFAWQPLPLHGNAALTQPSGQLRRTPALGGENVPVACSVLVHRERNDHAGAFRRSGRQQDAQRRWQHVKLVDKHGGIAHQPAFRQPFHQLKLLRRLILKALGNQRVIRLPKQQQIMRLCLQCAGWQLLRIGGKFFA